MPTRRRSLDGSGLRSCVREGAERGSSYPLYRITEASWSALPRRWAVELADAADDMRPGDVSGHRILAIANGEGDA